METPPPTRSCGDCALCCKLGEIPDFKPYNQWCQFCSTHQRCDIYATRPQPCRDFHCHYLLSDIGEEWRPSFCGMVVSTERDPLRMTVSVDPIHPERWREPLYLAQITHWSKQGPVTVMVGLRAYAIYPERIDDLGDITAEYTIVTTENQTAHGAYYLQQRMLRSEAEALTRPRQ